MFGQGNFALAPSYSHHSVPYARCMSMTEEKRAEAFAAFLKDTGVHTKSNTVTSTKGKLIVQGYNATKRKPGQNTHCKAMRTLP